jgi:circadian clock protein KaiC
MDRISTGIPGLDSLMEGGIPRGFIIMLAGNPGTGKTIFSSQFIYDGFTSSVLDNENSVYISFSESKVQYYINAFRLGMDFEKYEKQNKFRFLDFVALTGDGIEDAFEEILAAIRITKAKRVVLDSFSVLSMAFKEHVELRTTIHMFLGKLLRAEGITTILVIEIPYGSKNIGMGVEESLVDGIIRIEHGVDNASPLQLNILKMIGTRIDKERHVCNIISNEGMILYPKQSIIMTYPISQERISSGIPSFDERVNSVDGSGEKGLVKGTLTAIIGTTGSAKSTFAFQFIAEGVRKYGDTGIFCSLEDSVNEIKRMGTGYGYDVLELEKNGLSIYTSNSDNENPDAFIANLEVLIKRTKAKRLVIDGLSTFEQKHKKDIYMITKRISSLVHKFQITTLVTIHVSHKNESQFAELNLSPIFQNIILLRFVEVCNYMKRIMVLLKVTTAQQDSSILEFKVSVDRGGIEILGPFDNGCKKTLSV